MILDDYNSKLYLNNKVIDLKEHERDLLSYFIKNKKRNIFFNEIIRKFFYSETLVYTTIRALNKKMYPYAKIEARYKLGYILKIAEINGFANWKRNFLKEHKNTYSLLKLYDKKEKIEKDIKTLEKNII